jgi:hypothetical protein
VLRTKIDGKRKTKTIGTYGEVLLAEARKVPDIKQILDKDVLRV